MRVYEMLETAEKARERTLKLERELKWVAVREEEKELEKINAELQKRVSNLQKFTGDVTQLMEKKQTIEQSIQ